MPIIQFVDCFVYLCLFLGTSFTEICLFCVSTRYGGQTISVLIKTSKAHYKIDIFHT